MRMPEKIQLATGGSYLMSGVLLGLGKFGKWIAELDWNQIAIVSGVVIGVATFLANIYFQRQRNKYQERQTKAIEEAARNGRAIIQPENE